MPHADFVHLRVHTAYSLAEGAIKIKDLITQCAAARMPAVAITDSANMFGALEFATVAAEAGVQPIIGCQINIRAEVRASAGVWRWSAGPVMSRRRPTNWCFWRKARVSKSHRLVSQVYLDTDRARRPDRRPNWRPGPMA